MPPIPAKVVSEHGEVLYTRADIEKGRQVWQSIGGQQLGSIWGHGSYVAPDWTADWLHREAIAWLEPGRARRDTASPTQTLGADEQAAAVARLQPRIRTNTYDAASGTITVPDDRAAAIAGRRGALHRLFGDDPALLELRKAYAMKNGTVLDAENRQRAHRVHLVVGVVGGHRTPRRATSPTRTTGRTSRWSATRRRRTCSCGRCSACCS